MNALKKIVGIKDGREVTIRAPSAPEDVEQLYDFFNSLPEEVRNCARYNLRDRDFLARRLAQVDGAEHWRLIAEVEGHIVADGTLDRELFGWTRHVASMRCIVAPGFRKLGIGVALCRDLVGFGQQAGLERLYTELLAEQNSMIEAVTKAGFSHESTRFKYAKSPDGRLRDVLVYSNDLDAIWKVLANRIHDLDERPDRSGLY